MSAVALIPLTLWFFGSLLALPSLEYGIVQAWLAAPRNALFAALLVAALTQHAYLGTHEVVEDYVHGAAMKLTSLLLLRFAYVLLGGASLYAILRVAMASQAS